MLRSAVMTKLRAGVVGGRRPVAFGCPEGFGSALGCPEGFGSGRPGLRLGGVCHRSVDLLDWLSGNVLGTARLELGWVGMCTVPWGFRGGSGWTLVRDRLDAISVIAVGFGRWSLAVSYADLLYMVPM